MSVPCVCVSKNFKGSVCMCENISFLSRFIVPCATTTMMRK